MHMTSSVRPVCIRLGQRTLCAQTLIQLAVDHLQLMIPSRGLVRNFFANKMTEGVSDCRCLLGIMYSSEIAIW